MPDLGQKHECVNCGLRFYDLGKPEPVCPKCGTSRARNLSAAPSLSQSDRRRKSDDDEVDEVEPEVDELGLDLDDEPTDEPDEDDEP